VNGYQFSATPRFWKSFKKLPDNQKKSAKRAWQIFKQDPFDPRLRTHKINSLSSAMKRTVYAVEVEGNLRVVFYIDGDCIVTFNIGSHDVYRA